MSYPGKGVIDGAVAGTKNIKLTKSGLLSKSFPRLFPLRSGRVCVDLRVIDKLSLHRESGENARNALLLATIVVSLEAGCQCPGRLVHLIDSTREISLGPSHGREG